MRGMSLFRFVPVALYAASVTAQRSSPDPPKHWGGPRFKGKRVLVTGGDSGIGYAAVEAFYLECAKVLLHGHSEKKSAEALASVKALTVPDACADSPPSVEYAVADIRNASEVASLMNATVRLLGGLDIAVNNAGTAGGKTRQIGDPDFVDSSGKLYDESILDINLRGTLKCMNAELQYWESAKMPGVMVNVASIAGEVSWAGPLYSSSKWAMIGFTKQAALNYAGKGIRVNAVAPGAVNTTMLRDGRSPTDPTWVARREHWERLIPAGRIAEPWEMAGPITFLASDMATYVTGAVLTADGDLSQAKPLNLASAASAEGALFV